MCQKQGEPKGLDCFRVQQSVTFRRRDNSNLRKTLAGWSFLTCSFTLNLIDECHSLSYDALIAHIAIVFTIYMLLSLAQQKSDDQRMLDEIFFFLVDEMAAITFARSLSILMDTLLTSIQEILRLSDAQLETFDADFIPILPEYLQNVLKLQILSISLYFVSWNIEFSRFKAHLRYGKS